jgi:hypothetical protein
LQPPDHPPRTAFGRPSDPLTLFLAFCSAWAAAQIWLWPNDFVGECGPVTFVASVPIYARGWAFYCGLASALKLLGLASRLNTRWTWASTPLTVTGLFMSVLLWTIVSALFALRYPRSVTPIVLAGLALGAAWQLAQWRPARSARS